MSRPVSHNFQPRLVSSSELSFFLWQTSPLSAVFVGMTRSQPKWSTWINSPLILIIWLTKNFWLTDRPSSLQTFISAFYPMSYLLLFKGSGHATDVAQTALLVWSLVWLYHAGFRVRFPPATSVKCLHLACIPKPCLRQGLCASFTGFRTIVSTNTR